MVTVVIAGEAARAATQAVADGWLGAPWTFWSGLVGSGITAAVAITTLVLSNRLNLRRQAEQQDHDAKQKREDRKLAIRREVYLEAVEQAHALLGAIGSLCQEELHSKSDGDALQAFLKSNAKVWLVADAEAAHLSRELATQFSQLFLHARLASMPARRALEPVRIRAKDIERWETEAARLHEKVNDAQARKAPPDELARATALFEEAHEVIRLLKDHQEKARAEAMPLAFEAMRSTWCEMRDIQRSLCTLVSALRYELDLPRNNDRFLAQLDEMERSAWASLNHVFDIDPPEQMPDVGASASANSVAPAAPQ